MLVWVNENWIKPKAAGLAGVIIFRTGVLDVAEETRVFKKSPLGVVRVKLKASPEADDGRLTMKAVGVA